MLTLRLCAGFLVLAVIVPSSGAQVLPDVNVPRLPEILDTVNDTVGGVEDGLEATKLRGLRGIRLRALLRRNRHVLESGPDGEPIVRSELLIIDPSPSLLERAQREGFTIEREQRLEELGTSILVMRAPSGMSTQRALRRLQRLDPSATVDFNHVYSGGGSVDDSSALVPESAPAAAIAQLRHLIRLGLIDTGVYQAHPAFSTTAFRMYGCQGTAVPAAHGTAVASLMAMQITARLELYAADVYCDEPVGGSVTRIADAFAWMARERVPVINVSLVGPPNRTLEHVIQTMLKRGHIVVAAVGNDGPNAKPLYPAAYEGVIGVTGIDRRDRVILEAVRGPQVDFAAVGADIKAATLDDKFASVRGTSFAAPAVAALVALDRQELKPETVREVVPRFAKQARDLGAPGFDQTYGYGALSPPRAAQAQRLE